MALALGWGLLQNTLPFRTRLVLLLEWRRRFTVSVVPAGEGDPVALMAVLPLLLVLSAFILLITLLALCLHKQLSQTWMLLCLVCVCNACCCMYVKCLFCSCVMQSVHHHPLLVSRQGFFQFLAGGGGAGQAWSKLFYFITTSNSCSATNGVYFPPYHPHKGGGRRLLDLIGHTECYA